MRERKNSFNKYTSIKQILLPHFGVSLYKIHENDIFFAIKVICEVASVYLSIIILPP